MTNAMQEPSDRPKNSDELSKNEAISIDEVLRRIKFGKFNYFLIFVCGLIMNALLMETCGISFILPVSECDLHLTTSQKGILNTASFIGIVCSSHLWGYLADTKGRKCVIQPTLFIAFCLSVCSSLTNNFYLLTASRVLNGFFMSGSSATVYAYLGEFHDAIRRDRAIMAAVVIQGIAGLLMPLIAWSVINQNWMFHIPLPDIDYKPWCFFLVACGLPGLLSAISLILLPESPKFVLGQGKQIETIKILKKVNRWNNGSKALLDISGIREEPESIENRRRNLQSENSRFALLKSIGNQTVPLFKPPYLMPMLLICVIQFQIYATASGLFMWFPDILNRIATQNLNGKHMQMCEIINMPKNVSMILKLNENESTCVTKLELDTLTQGIVFETSIAIGLIIIGYLINKIRKSVILVFVLTLSGLGGVLCVLIDVPIIAVYSFMALLNCGLANSVISTSSVDVFPTDLRAMAISICLMCGRIGAVAGSNIFAILIDSQCNAAFLLSAASIIGTGILTLFIPKIHQKPSKSGDKNKPRLSISSHVS